MECRPGCRRYQHASEIKTDVETVSNSQQVRQTSNNSSSAAITDIDEQQRAAEIAEVPPDWLCLPIVALLITAWSTVGVLWNLRLPGLVVSLGVMAIAVYLVLQMKLRYLPKLQREFERVPRWSRALALVNGLALVIIGILLIISVQIRLLNNLFMTGVASGANDFSRLLEFETGKKAALELAASIGLQDVSLDYNGFGYSGPFYLWIVAFALLSAWSIGGAVVSYFNARRYRYTWKYNFAPAITTTLWFFSTLYVVHFAHLAMVGFATTPMPAREIRVASHWSTIEPRLAEWLTRHGYERAEYADFVLRDDQQLVLGEFHKSRYEAGSWFDAYQASWQYMLQRRRPTLVVSAASRKDDPLTVLKVSFPHLRRDSPEKQIWSQLGDDLETELHAHGDVPNDDAASDKPQLPKIAP